MLEKPWDEKVWFSPYYVIDQLSKITRTGDEKKIKRAKEAWVCAVAMICHAQARPAEWWIQLPLSDPPDVLAMNITPSNNGTSQDMGVIEVEVFEVSERDQEDIEVSLIRKLGNKDYSDMALIGFIRREAIIDHEVISKKLRKIKPKAKVIFFLACEDVFPNYALIQVYPVPFKIACNIGVYLLANAQKSFVVMSRGVKIKKTDLTAEEISALIP